MPGFSMCSNKDCKFKDDCLRFKAIPNDYQSYTYFAPNVNGTCDWFKKIQKQ